MSNLSKIGQKAFKIAAIVLLLFFYLYLYRFFSGYLSIIALIWVLGCMAFAIYAFLSEKQRLAIRSEFFKKTNLFFRYGDEVLYRTKHVPVRAEWTAEESGAFGYKIIDRIQNRFLQSYGGNPLNGSQVVTIIGATDREYPTDSRGFLKISFIGVRGAVFSRFITFQVLGKNVVIHLLAYLLGMPKLLDIIFFVVASPFSIFTWLLSWYREDYRIYARLAKEIDNSFEIMDMLAYYRSTQEMIAECIIDEMKVNGFYTQELAQSISFVFNNSNVNFGNQSYDNSINNYGTNYGTMGNTVNQ